MKIKVSGFTLVEIMIVIAVIGILAGSLFPALSSYLARSRDTARISDFRIIKNAIGLYKIDHDQYIPENGIYMDTSQGATFSSGWTSTGVGLSNWHNNGLGKIKGVYINNIPIDPTNKGIYFYSYEPVDHQTDYGISCLYSVCAYILSVKLENSNNPLATPTICNLVGNNHDYCVGGGLPDLRD